ncbi:MAG TPA: zf-HC2 domain-containing protein [Tepidisphaeraceae bacterium]|jgi:hypothetical protein
MSQNQEIIESKLCAYIDGELDPEGKAEIEKHLEANPQHRRLLESLRATRDLLRWLPREPAPAEIAETLNGQLERSVLLNYEGEHLGPSIWPKVFAAAAIVALTAGLGVAVYYALPRSQSPAQLALHAAAEPQSGNADVVPAPLATTEESPRRETAAAGRDREAVASKAGPSDMSLKEQVATTTPPAAVASKLADMDSLKVRGSEAEKKTTELDQLAQQVAQNPRAFIASAGNTANNFALYANAAQNGNGTVAVPLVLMVKSDAPEQTERQLTAYFNERQIQWRQAPLTFQAEANLRQPTPGAAPQNQSLDQNRQVMRREAGTEYGAFGGRAAKGGAEPPAEGLTASASPALNAAVPATQPTFAAKTESQNETIAQQQQPAPASQIQQDAMQTAVANNIRSDGVYVCQMSRQQAAQLSNTIANTTNPAAQVQELGTQTNKFAYANAGESQTAAPPVQLGAAGSGFGGGAISNDRQRLMKAAGGLEHEQPAKQSLADAKDAQNAAPAAAPSAVLSKPAGTELSASQPVPAEAAAPQAAPAATQPAQLAGGPTTAPADEAVNVVIMVQSNPAVPNAAAAPAPAPAAPPAEAQSQQPQQQQPAATSQSQPQAK